MSLEGALAANRFGLGAKPGEIGAASADPKAWLRAQLVPREQPLRFAGLPSASDLVAQLVSRREARANKDPEAVKAFAAEARRIYLREMAARFLHGFETDAPFHERLVRFWSNHFTVSVSKPQCAMFVGAFEREAIRPYVAGRFSDMLLAVERHPAMQLYLDNAQSIGPDSLAGSRSGKGLNENLGREILELHTLGVDGGQTQADVIALAKILTGWSIDRTDPPANGRLVARLMAQTGAPGEAGFRFYPPRHEPGAKTLLGRSYPEGYAGGVQALNDLAHHKATAHHIAMKLAIHFIADDPPLESVARISAAFSESGGDLAKTSGAIIDAPAAWRATQSKMRSPVDYLTAALRAAGGSRVAGLDEKSVAPLVQSARAMGEVPFGAPSPAGWPDAATAWNGADSVLERVEWANAAAEKWRGDSLPLVIADASLGPLLSASTRTAISRAASPSQGLALLFASPEFQRR